MKRSKTNAALTATQQALVDIVGNRWLFVWSNFYAISDRTGGYRHGYYDPERQKKALAARASISTVWALIKKGRLEKVTHFAADACGNRGYIYRPVKP